MTIDREVESDGSGIDPGLVYIEMISRRPGVGLHEFHAVAGMGQSGWGDEYGDDIAVLNVGRTWRMGEEPEYLCAWYSPGHGLERIDEWEATFASGAADRFEEPFRIAARIDRAGCYVPLLEPVVGTAGRYYAEWFDVAPGRSRDDVADGFRHRRERHGALTLNLLVDRIGLLGPAPRGLAVWGVPSWAAVAEIAEDLTGDFDGDGDDGAMRPVRLVSASFYADFGREQL
ncbi:MAG: hypothetical protein ACR2HP_05195 [Ilumatobacteraceae bacterium]